MRDLTPGGGAAGTLVPSREPLPERVGDPFVTAPVETDPAAWIAIPSRVSVLDDLTTWITDREASRRGGLAVVSGDAGSGRTALLTALAGSLAEHPGLVVATVADDGNRRSDALLPRAMIAALGAVPAGRTGRELIAEARAEMRTHLDAGRRPVLLIDNAALNGSQLEIVRMLLLPMEDDRSPDPLLVLFGPPELGDRIRRRRALAGMVERSYILPPLEPAEIGALLAGPLGGRSWFSGEAIAIIAAWSGGNPAGALRIAGACRREAIARNRTDVDGEIARDIATLLSDSGEPGAPPPRIPADAVQTRLDLGFPVAELAPVPSGRSPRARRRG